jgi:aconitate hydratase
MLAAGLLAKKAVERGFTVNPLVKASLAPGSRVVSDYLNKTGLQPLSRPARLQPRRLRLHDVHRQFRPAASPVEEAVVKNDLIAAAVLSGNRNFEARVHQNIKANFLMSPPLVVAFALAGRVDIDLTNDPLGTGKDGKPVLLRTSGRACGSPRPDADRACSRKCSAGLYKDFAAQNPKWNEIPSSTGNVYEWDRKHLHPGTAVLREFQPAARQHRESRRPAAGDFWRQRDDRPHFARRFHQENFARPENI